MDASSALSIVSAQSLSLPIMEKGLWRSWRDLGISSQPFRIQESLVFTSILTKGSLELCLVDPFVEINYIDSVLGALY